jgi:hypothetical protein
LHLARREAGLHGVPWERQSHVCNHTASEGMRTAYILSRVEDKQDNEVGRVEDES